ncbi:MAG: hypothetical protein OXC62_06465 [Aestuariivita sp.]|nr:hypothetical protein [Aestuariivita sp.]
MKCTPGLWSEQLIKRGARKTKNEVQNLGDYGKDIADQVMIKAQKNVSRFMVVIGNTGIAGDNKNIQDINPGTGILVQLNNSDFGILTAARVLKRGDNRKNCASVGIFILLENYKQNDKVTTIIFIYLRNLKNYFS